MELSPRRLKASGSQADSRSAVERSLSGSSSFVTMMESADLGQFNHSSNRWELDRARNRSVFCQPQVSSRFLVIVKVRSQSTPQTTLVQNDNVVETLPPD
jgi:hypothetical protein